MLVRELMTKDVITVTPDDTLKDVGKILKEKRISGIPVVDAERNVVGVITLTDMLRILNQIYHWKEMELFYPGVKLSEMFEDEKCKAQVRDVMTKVVSTLEEDRPVEDLMRLFFHRKVHTIPITKNGKLSGIAGKRDLVYACF